MSNRKRIRHVVSPRLADAGQALDVRYFDEHPTVKGYTRPATADELKALSFPVGTTVYVHLIGPNTRARAFVLPATTRSN